MKQLTLIVLLLLLFLIGLFFLQKKDGKSLSDTLSDTKSLAGKVLAKNPMSIDAMRERKYPASGLSIEKTLAPGSNYSKYIASYLSDGLKIYGLLTVPNGDKPKAGWPAIIFNHGYIPPEQYRTTERYVAYTDAFSRNGYIVFKSDYRGNGDSEGRPEGAYYSPAYTVDVLEALASIKQYKDADPNRIGMWGHSMGGNVTLRALVVDPKDIKVAVIWGGVVGSYDDLMNNWHRSTPFQPSERERAGGRNASRSAFTKQFGTPKDNPGFWNTIDPTAYIDDIVTPLQLDHSTTDEEVPVEFSEKLYDNMKKAGKNIVLYTYPGDDHNISANLSLALDRSVAFFDTYLKK